jgi:hypothetical protein
VRQADGRPSAVVHTSLRLRGSVRVKCRRVRSPWFERRVDWWIDMRKDKIVFLRYPRNSVFTTSPAMAWALRAGLTCGTRWRSSGIGRPHRTMVTSEERR